MPSSVVPARRPRLRVLPGGATRPSDELSDAEVVAAIVNGDRRAAEHLYDRVIQVVEVTLFRVLGGRGTDHEDLVQSAFEQIMLTLVRQRFGQACSLRAWAASVTSHLALNVIRTRTRDRRRLAAPQRRDTELELASTPTDLERQIAARDEVERVRGILSAMKPERATALVLHDVLGHDLAEIAALTGISTSAAQSRLFRARTELAERLDAELGASTQRGRS